MEGDFKHSLNQYRLLEKLGEGGMGEVYLAHDSSLDRPVALKFLSRKKEHGAAARKRLVEEARSAAALDHPFICKVYEVGHSADGDFIAMEYVEGLTLNEKLLEGALGVRDTIAHAVEIAEALRHAHSKGIIHRDLKPSNIMLTTAGHVKIMDFGLAKRIEKATDAEHVAESISTGLTQPGTVLGTPLYMSPEQLLGKPADRRSDIFSFGIVLYEMLTGTHPFKRSNSFETGNAILSENPSQLSLKRETLLPLLAYIIKKMLAKEPGQRYQSVHEICTDLRELREPGSRISEDISTQRRPWYRSAVRALLFGIGLLTMLPATYWLYQRWHTQSGQEPVPVQELLIDWPSRENSARISSDGKWLVFLSDWGGGSVIWKKSLSGGEPEPLNISGTPISFAWSPDGMKLACLVKRKDNIQLELIPVFFRGTPDVLASLNEMEAAARADLAQGFPQILCWIGDRIYLRGQKRVWQFKGGSKVMQGVLFASDLGVRSICIRADEKKIVYDSHDEIWMADLDGKNVERLTKDEWRDLDPHWVKRNGGWRIIFSTNRGGQVDLWELNPESRDLRPLTTYGLDAKLMEDSSPDGSMVVYQVIREEANLWSCDASTGAKKPLTTGVLSDFAPTIAVNSNRIAFQRIKPQLTQGSLLIDSEIYLAELGNMQSAGLQNVLSEEGIRMVIREGSTPFLSPDGLWLAYLRFRKEGSAFELWLRDLTTSRDWPVSDRVLIDEISIAPRDWGPHDIVWSADSSSLFFVEKGEHGTTILRRLDPRPDSTGPKSSVVIYASGQGERILDPKPNGDMSGLVYVLRKGDKPPAFEIRFLELASGRERTLLSQRGPDRIYCLGWSRNTVVALRSFRSDRSNDTSSCLEILKLESGEWRKIGQIERAYGSTAISDSVTGDLYVTAIEANIPNIVAFQPLSGKSMRLTDNQRADTTFAGLHNLGAGKLVYSQEKHVNNLFLMRFR